MSSKVLTMRRQSSITGQTSSRCGKKTDTVCSKNVGWEDAREEGEGGNRDDVEARDKDEKGKDAVANESEQ